MNRYGRLNGSGSGSNGFSGGSLNPSWPPRSGEKVGCKTCVPVECLSVNRVVVVSTFLD